MVYMNMNGGVFQDVRYKYELRSVLGWWILILMEQCSTMVDMNMNEGVFQDGGNEYEWRSVLG